MQTIRMEPIIDASAWKGSEMAGDHRWIIPFSQTDLEELDAALQQVNAAGLEMEAITRESFPLSTLSERLAEWLAEVKDGRGFVLLRGFPVGRYSETDIRRLYWGMGVHLGTLLSQNSYGDLIGNIWDEGMKIAQGHFGRQYGSNKAPKFHTDRADVVGLLCLQPAQEGGLSSIMSSLTLYNEILAHHPEFLPTLYDGFIFTKSEEGTEPVQWRVPMFTLHEGVVSCRISRNHVERGRIAGAPFTDLEIAALEYIDELSARGDIRLDMEFRKGDIQLINNFTTIHARTAYVDGPDPTLRRHLLRIWVKLRERRPIGPYYAEYEGIPKILNRT
jgi:hypothetical protein